MSDSPLLMKSKAFVLEIIRVCKEIKCSQIESILTNHLAVPGQVLVQISGKHFMYIAGQFLLLSYKLH